MSNGRMTRIELAPTDSQSVMLNRYTTLTIKFLAEAAGLEPARSLWRRACSHYTTLLTQPFFIIQPAICLNRSEDILDDSGLTYSQSTSPILKFAVSRSST